MAGWDMACNMSAQILSSNKQQRCYIFATYLHLLMNSITNNLFLSLVHILSCSTTAHHNLFLI